MQCLEIMTREPQFLQQDDTVQHASAAMRDADVGFLPVCDASRQVLGAVTDRDIVLRIVADDRSHQTCVRDIMSASPVTCHPDTDLHAAEKLMQEHQISRLLCVDPQGALSGVISLADLARASQQEAAATQEAVKAPASASN